MASLRCCQQRSGRSCGPAVRTRARAVRVVAALPPVMVNSCTGKMGHAAAEALVASGFKLIPTSFTGLSTGVAVSRIGVRGVPMQLVDEAKRQGTIDELKAQYPNMIVVDYTLAHCVEEHVSFYSRNNLPFVMGTAGGNRQQLQAEVAASGAYAVLPSPAGEQAAALHALLTSLRAPLPARVDEYGYEAIGRACDAAALDLLNPAAGAEIAARLRDVGIACDEGQVSRMRTARQGRLDGQWHLEREPASFANLQRLQGRGGARACRITPPGGGAALVLRHYGIDRSAFAAGAVEAARFLAERVAEGSEQRAYDFVDVLRAVYARRHGGAAAGGGAVRLGSAFSGNVVAAGAAVTAAAAMA